MKSTRSNMKVKASEAIIKGLAEDGGLFVFEEINNTFYNERFIGRSYQETALEVMDELLDDFGKEELKEIINSTYNQESFLEGIVDIIDFDDYAYLSLYKGETFSFKDMALSILPKLLKLAKKKQNDKRKSIVLTATSGDTGSATLAGFSKTNTDCIVLYPNNGVSQFQEMQMLQYQSEKNRVIAINGNFDDAQRTVKKVFAEVDDKLNVASANSINIGRIVPQVVYYVYAYSQLVNSRVEFNEKIDVIVPTGNFGNIYSCYIAKSLGVPIDKMVIASNSNDVLTDLFDSGLYNIDRELFKTITPSMDIVVSSNLERYLSTFMDSDELGEVMSRLIQDGSVKIPNLTDKHQFLAYSVNESKTIEAIQNEKQHIIDPHTAVAKAIYDSTVRENYSLIVSTASPIKFEATMCDALYIQEGTLKHLMKDYDSRSDMDVSNFDRITVDNAYEYIMNVLGGIVDEN